MPRRLAVLARRTRLWPLWARYVGTAAIVLVAFFFRWVLLGPGAGYPYLVAFPAVIISGLVLNRGSAFFAAFLSAVVGEFLFVAPVGSFHIAAPYDAVALVIFMATSLLVAVLIEDLHATIFELAEANRRLAVAEAEQDVLRREAAHRRQNDLGRLIATLRLQAQASEDERVRVALRDAIGRIQALARVDIRFDRRHNGDGMLDTHDLLTGLVEDIRQTGGAELRPIALEVSAEKHELLREQAVNLGLVTTELVTNALKYAFPEDRPGTVSVVFRRDGESFTLTVADSGVGFDQTAAPKGTGLGRRLVRALVGQLGGRVEVRSGEPEGGTVCTVRFPACRPESIGSVRSSPGPEPSAGGSSRFAK